MDAHHSTSMPAPIMCSGSSAWGSVSPKCTIMRMAWIRGVKKSWPWGLNSSLRHLHGHRGGCSMAPVWPVTGQGTALAASAQFQVLTGFCQQDAPELTQEAQALLEHTSAVGRGQGAAPTTPHHSWGKKRRPRESAPVTPA